MPQWLCRTPAGTSDKIGVFAWGHSLPSGETLEVYVWSVGRSHRCRSEKCRKLKSELTNRSVTYRPYFFRLQMDRLHLIRWGKRKTVCSVPCRQAQPWKAHGLSDC